MSTTPKLILVSDFFRTNGYASNPPGAAYMSINRRLNNGTYPCLRVSKYKRYVTAETAKQMLADHPPQPIAPEKPDTTPTLTVVEDATSPTQAETSPDNNNLNDLHRDLTALTTQVAKLTEAITSLNHRIPLRRAR